MDTVKNKENNQILNKSDLIEELDAPFYSSKDESGKRTTNISKHPRKSQQLIEMEKLVDNNIAYLKEHAPRQFKEFNALESSILNYFNKLIEELEIGKDKENTHRLFWQVKSVLQNGFDSIMAAEKNALLSDKYILENKLYKNQRNKIYKENTSKFYGLIYKDLPEYIGQFKQRINEFIESKPTYEEIENFFIKNNPTSELSRVQRDSEYHMEWLESFNKERLIRRIFRI